MNHDSQLATLLDRFVRRMHVEMRKKAMTFDPHRVGPGGAILLLTVHDLGRPSMQALATHMVRDKSQLTREVRSLETKGLLARFACDQDQRVTQIGLTDAGVDLVQRHQTAVGETLDLLLNPLPQSDQVQLRQLLHQTLLLDAQTQETADGNPATA